MVTFLLLLLQMSNVSLTGESLGRTLPKSSISGDTEIEGGFDSKPFVQPGSTSGTKRSRNKVKVKRYGVSSILDKVR
jgi:hypothetical protein